MGNCIQREKSDKQRLRDNLLKEKDETGMITFYDKEKDVYNDSRNDYDILSLPVNVSLGKSVFDIDGSYTLDTT